MKKRLSLLVCLSRFQMCVLFDSGHTQKSLAPVMKGRKVECLLQQPSHGKMKNGKDKAGPAIEDVPVAASFPSPVWARFGVSAT